VNGTDPREPAAWLATIARNECWSRIRTRMREPLPTEELEIVSTTDDPLAEAIRSADLRALWVAIEELPRQQRDALLLREFGGLTYAELAAALAVSGSAVESLLFRARDGLRGKLRAVYGAITGASWIEALVRVAVGGGAPVAAKVTVLGLGAAAVGSGAVVVPHAFDNHRPSHGPLRVPAAVVAPRPKSPPAPVFVARVVPTSVSPAPVHTSDSRTHRSREHEAEQVATRRGGDEGTPAALQPVSAQDSHSGSGGDGHDVGGGGHGGSGDHGGSGGGD
jgi:hypothetical protein